MKRYMLIAVTAALLSALCGCAQNTQTLTPTAANEVPSDQKLIFSVTAAEEPGYTVLSQEELGGETDAYISYWNLAEVNIRVDGADIPLAEAIRGGGLAVPELFAFARMDARNGYCEETYVSEHGLTHFTYRYPECVLELAYDVYETPDGNQTRIDEVSITNHGSNLTHFYLDENSEWGYFLDREDWGLTFEVSSVSPTQITLDYTQHGGQQIGELFIENYLIFPVSEEPREGPGFIGSYVKDLQPIPILSDASGQITIDWSADAGSLEPGSYHLQMYIVDSYEESDVHPLMANYYDKQRYDVAFSISDGEN